MAKQIWNNPIDKRTDWGGDESTGNAPVSGEQVQRFIKDTFEKKAGVFHYDSANNRYLVFADEDTKNAYIQDPTQTSLILGTFDAPFNYSAEINLSSEVYTAIPLGASNNYIEFTFDIKNKSGISTGEDVTVTYTFTNRSTKQVVTESRLAGEFVSFNIDKYLKEGTNNIIIGIVGKTTLAATTISVRYDVVNLYLSDDTNIAEVFNLSNGSKVMTIDYSIRGTGTKYVEWYLDGEKLPSVGQEDIIVEAGVEGRRKSITLSSLASGVHHIQFCAYTTINGTNFYTDTLYREILVDNGDTDKTFVAVAAVIPHSHGFVNDSNPFVFYGIEQYLPYNLTLATSKTGMVKISLGGEEIATINSVRGEQNEITLTTTKSGASTLSFEVLGSKRDISSYISSTSLNIREIDEFLEFDFSASKKSNSSIDKDSWSYGDYQGSFSGFNWNPLSGWVNGSLLFNEGASLEINYAPLGADATITGKTIEIEFSTYNVEDDDAVVCDLRDTNGAGLLITASEARLVSKVGKVVYTKFKSGESNRIAFVINKETGVTNRSLVFIYINGILSGAINYGSADDFISRKTLTFAGTTSAQLSLIHIRVYSNALSSSEILNNYILYRSMLSDMRSIYDRNDIYDGVFISADKAKRRLPVMIITGDIERLNATSSTDTVEYVDIKYENDQDPSKNFEIESAQLRIQGTSSLYYPRKNYRFYTRKSDYTVLRDANGKIVQDRLYAFKDGAQPVDCWCLKADFAESSGTHNTGVARLWNDVMYNASFEHTNVLGQKVEGFPLRTKAQNTAVANNFKYDVRTTIDGFPILLFHRATETDDLIFLGKYNFNNDKSTPSVFGFEGIPNFDDSKVSSWEFLENEDPIAWFETVDGFYSDVVDESTGEAVPRWTKAFEARHEGRNASIDDLYAFASWMVSMKEKPSEFATQKWAHMDVYKVAAYYVYLMRFGALDQVVKNCFLTTEDGIKWYFINYDNDTILGVDNTGEISAPPTVDRTSRYDNGSYVYAGNNSVLWNMLEADAEFMSIVRVVDNALYESGLTYKDTIEMFNDKQSDKWVETVYNQDSQYKYVDSYLGQGENYLTSLQGARRSHRIWWLSKRFSLYDSYFVSGDYSANNVEIKCLNSTPSGLSFSIVPAISMNYGYAINREARVTGVALDANERHTFTIETGLGIGTPVGIYAAPNLKELDLSVMSPYLNTLNISNVYSDTLGTMFRTLIMGNGTSTNTSLNVISGLDVATRLRKLDIRGFKGITELDLTNQMDFRELYAQGSGLASVDFAEGAPVSQLHLPSSLLALNLQYLPNLAVSGLSVEGNWASVESISIKGCPLLVNDFGFIKNWIDNKTIANSAASLEMDNVDWKDVDPNDLITLGSIGHLSLKGNIVLSSISLGQINRLIEIFGESVFAKGGELYIDAPNAVFVIGRTSLLEGESETYSVISFGSEVLEIRYSIYGTTPTGVTLDGNTITTTETGSDRSFTLRVIVRTVGGTRYSDTAITVTKRVYPTSSNTTIEGSNRVNLDVEEYVLSYPESVNGDFKTTWSLSVSQSGYLEIESYDDYSCRIKKLQESIDVVTATLTATITKRYNGASVVILTKALELVNENIAETDAGIVAALHNAGLCASDKYITKEEAARIIDVDLQSGTTEQTSIFYNYRSQIKNFEGFQYFTSVVNINPYMLSSIGSAIETIIFPPSVKGIDGRGLNYTYVRNIILNEGLERINTYAIVQARVKEIVFPSTLKFLGESWLSTSQGTYMTTLVKLDASKPTQLETLYADGQGRYDSLEDLRISASIKKLAAYNFDSVNLRAIYCYAKQAPDATDAFITHPSSSNSQVYAGQDYYGKKVLYTPVNATGYNSMGWDFLLNPSKCGFVVEHLVEGSECLSLSITADDVTGRATKAKIHWTAKVNGIDTMTGEAVTNFTLTGEADSEYFPMNESTTETIEREVSFTYLGVTAKTTITQGVFAPQIYEVVLNSQWQQSAEIANPDSAVYDGVYESFSNKGVNNSEAIMYVDIDGYETFRLYIRSNAESTYDYVMVSQLDKAITGSTSNTDTTLVKAHTKGNQQSGTAISNYTLVEFTGIDEGSHRITIVYRKDSSTNSGTDQGYVLIPKDQ